MTNRRPDLVETSGGWEPHTSGGERILVALAGVALLGGVLIVGGNLLKQHDEVNVASPGPSPTVRPLPTALPTASPQELVVTQPTQASSSPATPGPSLFGGWIRATVDLPVRSDASASTTVVGTLKAGALAYVDEQDQGARDMAWATVEAPSPTGWVAMRANGKDLVKRYEPVGFPGPGSLWGIAAGENGFVAFGSPPSGPNLQPGPEIYVSADGATWHVASDSPLHDEYPSGVAWGPAGWILVSSGGRGSATQVWSSPDGDHWAWVGLLDGYYVNSLVGSAKGYLLQAQPGGFGGGANQSWFSSDGIHWTESKPAVIGNYQVTATEGGFYAHDTSDCCPGSTNLSAAFSTDGLTWHSTRPNLLVATASGVLVGIEPDASGRGAQAMRGSYYRGQLGWRVLSGGWFPFVGAVVTSVVSDGQRATALGWDAASEAPLTWTSDGGPWTRHELPAAFGGLPAMAAARKGVAVAVGSRTNWRGPNPIIWHEGAAGSWEPEASPVIGLPPDPSTGECGTPPTDPAEFSNLDRGVAVACFASTPMTFRMWSAKCDGCSGQSNGTYAEGWLANPSPNFLYLCPVKWPDNCWTTVVLAPTLAQVPDATWLDAWVEVTGHFDDPASASCHWIPPPDQLRYYGGTSQIVDQCRQQFVVTKVRVVPGP